MQRQQEQQRRRGAARFLNTPLGPEQAKACEYQFSKAEGKVGQENILRMAQQARQQVSEQAPFQSSTNSASSKRMSGFSEEENRFRMTRTMTMMTIYLNLNFIH